MACFVLWTREISLHRYNLCYPQTDQTLTCLCYNSSDCLLLPDTNRLIDFSFVILISKECVTIYFHGPVFIPYPTFVKTNRVNMVKLFGLFL